MGSCTRNSNTNATEEKPVASVGDSKFYPEDLTRLTPHALSAKDSVAIRKKIIENWAANELFYKKALENLDEEALNVDKEVEQYRKDLIAYKYELKLISEQLDTSITDAEIETYYNNNPQDFLLKNNIVKAVYVKAPKTIPNIDKLRKLCLSTNPKDSVQFKSMCIQFADNYFIDNSTWLLLDDIKKEIPQLREVPDYGLSAGKVFEFNDSLSYYFLKIKDIKIKNSLSPLNFEKANIKHLLMDQRKQYLIKTYKKDLLEKAKTDKTIINY
ncbi:MAG: hypothetical protein JST26_18640 [Bacteroidetes bacterium]|nr:hypothetical protein [Bacteroidota bacterium]